MSKVPDIVVIGSANMDLVVLVDHIPAAGISITRAGAQPSLSYRHELGHYRKVYGKISNSCKMSMVTLLY